MEKPFAASLAEADRMAAAVAMSTPGVAVIAPLVARLNSIDLEVRMRCIDMLGHGLAPNPPGERTLDDFVQQVHEVIQTIAERYGDTRK